MSTRPPTNAHRKMLATLAAVALAAPFEDWTLTLPLVIAAAIGWEYLP